MTAQRVRTILGIISLTSLILSTYLSTVLSFKVAASPPLYLNLLSALIFSFNIAILFAWASAGIAGGVLAAFVSVIAVILVVLRTAEGSYLLLAASFLVTTILGYLSVRYKDRVSQTHVLKSEKLDEEANLLANAIKEKQANITSLEGKLTRYSMLKDVVESLSMTLSLDDINKLIIENVSRTLAKSGRILLFLVDIKSQDLMLSALKGDAAIVKEKKGDIYDHWILRNRKTLIVEAIEKDFRFPADSAEKTARPFRSLIASPLVSQDKVIGILRMDSPQEFAYTQDDLRLLTIISDLAAVAIQNAYLYSRTQELARRDDLTGLVVRRYFMERFREEIKRAAAKRQAFSLLILDIDHFKDYNDKYGHMAGDLVLKHMARILTSAVQEGDIVGRYGGEELIVLLVGRDKAEAIKEAQRLRNTIKERPFTLRRSQTKLTVSAGLSSYPKDAVTEEDLIRIADDRLYKAKTTGRDKVCSD